MAKNIHKVNKHKWRKWGPVAQEVFNRLYYTMKKNPSVFLATGQEELPKRRWKVTAWNAAWLAADFAEEANG